MLPVISLIIHIYYIELEYLKFYNDSYLKNYKI